MMRAALIAVAAGLIAVAAGCGSKDLSGDDDGGRDGDSRNGAAADPNAAVKAQFWGEERVAYAKDVRWEGRMPAPDAEWPRPPGDAYLEFTYYGDKLVKLEGLDTEGEPRHFSKLGVRQEWTYASHGGVLEDATYEADGTVTYRARYRYDDHSRCASKREFLDGIEKIRSTYAYVGDGRTRTQTLELLADDGRVVDTEVTTEHWDPERSMWVSTEQTGELLE